MNGFAQSNQTHDATWSNYPVKLLVDRRQTIPVRSAFGLARHGTTAPVSATRHRRIPWSFVKTPVCVGIENNGIFVLLTMSKAERKRVRTGDKVAVKVWQIEHTHNSSEGGLQHYYHLVGWFFDFIHHKQRIAVVAPTN